MRLFSISLNMCLGVQKNHLIETVLLSTHNIGFGWERIKIIFSYTLLSGGLNYIKTVARRYIFCGSFMFFSVLFFIPLCVSVYLCPVVNCWEMADLMALVYGVYCEFVTFPLVSWTGVVLDCIDSWSLLSFLLLYICYGIVSCTSSYVF